MIAGMPPRGCARDVLDYIDGLFAYCHTLRDLPCLAGTRRGWHLDPPVPVAWEWSA